MKISVRKIGSRWQPVDSAGNVVRGDVYNADGTGYTTREGAAEAAAMLRVSRTWKPRIAESHATKIHEPIVGQWYRIEWNQADDRVQIHFDDELNVETRALLKSRGFRKAPAGIWQKPASEGAWWSAIEIARRAS